MSLKIGDRVRIKPHNEYVQMGLTPYEGKLELIIDSNSYTVVELLSETGHSIRLDNGLATWSSCVEKITD